MIEKCPECGSHRMTEILTYQLVIEKNVNTGKVLRKDKHPERGCPVMWSLKCRECKWSSETYAQ